MDETSYQIIAIGGISLLGIGMKIYYDLKNQKRVKEFQNFGEYVGLEVNSLKNKELKDLEISSESFINKLEKKINN